VLLVQPAKRPRRKTRGQSPLLLFALLFHLTISSLRAFPNQFLSHQNSFFASFSCSCSSSDLFTLAFYPSPSSLPQIRGKFFRVYLIPSLLEIVVSSFSRPINNRYFSTSAYISCSILLRLSFTRSCIWQLHVIKVSHLSVRIPGGQSLRLLISLSLWLCHGMHKTCTSSRTNTLTNLRLIDIRLISHHRNVSLQVHPSRRCARTGCQRYATKTNYQENTR